MNPAALIADMLKAASAAAKGHASDLKEYLKARTRLIADGVIAIAGDHISGAINDDDVRFAFAQIRESEKTAALAAEATGLAAAQDAINAALAVAAAAASAATGIALP